MPLWSGFAEQFNHTNTFLNTNRYNISMADPRILHKIGSYKISNGIEERRELAKRYGAGRVFVVRGDLMPSGTIKDLRNAAILKKFSHLNPLVIPQITSGNSGRSLELLASELDPKAERLKLVNISAEEMDEKVKNGQGEENTYLVNLGNGRIYMQFMRELARQHLKMPDLPDRNIIGVEHFFLPEGYSSIVDDISAQLGGDGIIPTHISCPLGAGELLAEIGWRAMEVYGESCPMIIGNTVSRNPFAEQRSSSEDAVFACNLADKLVTDVSNYLLSLERLKLEDALRVNTILSGRKLKGEYEFVNSLGISAEPSAVTAFCGIDNMEFSKNDVLVLICSGRGNFNPDVLWSVGQASSLGVGTDTLLEYSAVVEHDPKRAMAIRGRELLNAVENSNHHSFNFLMAMRRSNPESVSLEELDKNGNSALGIAMVRGEFDMAISLMNAGAHMLENDASVVNKLLQEVVEKNNLNRIKAAVMAGADSSLRGENGGNALITAIKKHNMVVAEMLLPNYKNIEFQDSDGKTAMFHAVDLGELEFAKKLAELGASHLVEDSHYLGSCDCIELAAKNNYLEFLEYLIKVNWDNMGLMASCGSALEVVSDVKAAKILLKAIDNLAKKTDFDLERFIGTSTYADRAIGDYLLNEVASGNVLLREKMCYLGRAIPRALRGGNPNLVEFLFQDALDTYYEIARGVKEPEMRIPSINDMFTISTYNHGWYLIERAIANGWDELVKRLARLEKETGGSSESIHRALLTASAKRDLESADVLIECGADPSFKERVSCAFDCLYFGASAVDVKQIMKKKGYALGREDRIYHNPTMSWDTEHERNFYSWICSSGSVKERKLKAKVVEKLIFGTAEVNPQVANFLFYLADNPDKYEFREYGGRAKLFELIVEKLNWKKINSKEEWTFWKGKLVKDLVSSRREKEENAIMILLLAKNFESEKEKNGALYFLAAARDWIE